MTRNNLRIFFKKYWQNLVNYYSDLSPSYIFGVFMYVFIVFILSVNMYTAYTKGMENLSRLEVEQGKTDKLLDENAELKRLVKYYSSIDYKKIYARDNLSMAEAEETLYRIERGEDIEIEKIKEIKVERRQDNIYMWNKLIFGI